MDLLEPKGSDHLLGEMSLISFFFFFFFLKPLKSPTWILLLCG